jgi:hypothetical protein
VDKRTAITYIDSDGNWHRASKGAPEQVSLYGANFTSQVPALAFMKSRTENVFFRLYLNSLPINHHLYEYGNGV